MMDRADIYAAMAAQEDEADDAAMLEKPMVNPSVFNLHGGAGSKLVIDDRTVEVANLVYVQRLEQLLREQDIRLKKMDRVIHSLGVELRQQRQTINKQSGRLLEMSGDIDNKIDRRN